MLAIVLLMECVWVNVLEHHNFEMSVILVILVKQLKYVLADCKSAVFLTKELE